MCFFFCTPWWWNWNPKGVMQYSGINFASQNCGFSRGKVAISFIVGTNWQFQELLFQIKMQRGGWKIKSRWTSQATLYTRSFQIMSGQYQMGGDQRRSVTHQCVPCCKCCPLCERSEAGLTVGELTTLASTLIPSHCDVEYWVNLTNYNTGISHQRTLEFPKRVHWTPLWWRHA